MTPTTDFAANNKQYEKDTYEVMMSAIKFYT